MADIDTAIAERAARQLGLITQKQCHGVGATRHMVDSRVRRGSLERVSAHVLRVAGSPRTWRQRVLAACLEAGDDAVASHRTAAALLRLAGATPGLVEITVPRNRRPRRVDGLVHRARDLLAVDVGHVGPMPVTTASRTLIDCAPVVTPQALETIVDTALRDGVVRESYLRWRIERLRKQGRPGIAAIEEALKPPPTADGRRPHSWLERRLIEIIARAELPPPRVQVHRRGKDGRVSRVDLFYDEQRVVIEALGHRTHSTRRQLQADAERSARLTAAGHAVYELTYEDVVERPDYVAGIVAAALRLAHLAA